MKTLIKYILRLIGNAAVLYFATAYLPGISVGNEFAVALMVIFILSLYNALIRPIVKLITLPINFLTLGLYSFFSNVLVLYGIAFLINGFEITSFVSALILSIILSAANSILDIFLK